MTGYYQKPKEESKIFMFLDLQSSSKIAELLGHEKYSDFIQDCFRAHMLRKTRDNSLSMGMELNSPSTTGPDRPSTGSR